MASAGGHSTARSLAAQRADVHAGRLFMPDSFARRVAGPPRRLAVVLLAAAASVIAQQEEGAAMKGPKLEVKVGSTRIVLRASNYPALFRFADASIALSASGNTVRSLSGGDRWQPWTTDLPLKVDGALGRLADGTAISLAQRTKPVPGQPDTYVGQRWLSRDNGLTISGPEPVYVTCPNVTQETVEGTDTLAGPIFHGDVIPLAAGRLVMAPYTTFPQDAANGGETVKLRTILVRSTDDGVHWGYVATIGSMDRLQSDEDRAALRGQEGFCEPTLARLPNGKLICVMRAGTYVDGSAPSDTYHDLATTVVKEGKYTTTGEGPCRPLYIATSTDEGETWTVPKPMAAAHGACPRLIVLQNGVLALSYGRMWRPSQGNAVLFSADGGETWGREVILSHGLSSGYTYLVETAPNKILVVFDVVTAWGPQGTPDWIGAVDLEVKAE